MPISHPLHAAIAVDFETLTLTRETDDRLWLDIDEDKSINLATSKRQALALADKITPLYRGRRVAGGK